MRRGGIEKIEGEWNLDFDYARSSTRKHTTHQTPGVVPTPHRRGRRAMKLTGTCGLDINKKRVSARDKEDTLEAELVTSVTPKGMSEGCEIQRSKTWNKGGQGQARPERSTRTDSK